MMHRESSAIVDIASGINVILYGPPGTGKSYETIERSVKLIAPSFSGDHAAHKRKFDEMRREGRVEFITFHQSYSYEDFIEGIRPVVDTSEEVGSPRYECRPGAFKRLACNALFDCLETAEAVKQLVPFEVLWKALLSQIESEPEARYRGLSEKTSYQLTVTPRGNLEGINVISDKKFLCSRKILEHLLHCLWEFAHAKVGNETREVEKRAWVTSIALRIMRYRANNTEEYSNPPV